MSKEYGLIIPNKNKTVITPSAPIKRAAIFDEDSDSDPDSARPTGLPRTIKRQDRVVQEKAVEEDPTVYQYDEIYDEMDQKRKDSKLSRKDLDKKPKYINKLLVAADRRKRENERRIERQVQKEREAEGEEFKDKEAFVTAAYKKKLEEMKELEEQEKREEYLESIGDVRKQGNLDGFYRHLYEQKVVKVEESVEDMKLGEDIKKSGEDMKKPIEVEETVMVKKEDESKGAKRQNVRRYRKREDSKSEEEDNEDKEKSHLASNLDADSDFSIDSESEDDDEKTKAVDKVEVVVKVEKKDDEDVDEKKEVKGDVEVEEAVVEVKPKKPKIDIWKKRTVGTVFDEALQRYYERKALRESG